MSESDLLLLSTLIRAETITSWQLGMLQWETKLKELLLQKMLSKYT